VGRALSSRIEWDLASAAPKAGMMKYKHPAPLRDVATTVFITVVQKLSIFHSNAENTSDLTTIMINGADSRGK